VGGVIGSGKAGSVPAEWAERTESFPEWMPTSALRKRL
jgi:hypothetical protein